MKASGLSIAFLMLVVSSETVVASESCVGLQVAHGGLQRGDGRRIVSGCLLLRRGVGFRLGCRGLRIGCCLLRLLQLLILGGKIALQAVDLALKLLLHLVDLLLHRRAGRRGGLLGCGVLFCRRR